ncbi:MAG: hypothetical protein AAF821_11670 [Cyanobacteria bacterium P01_D01_bin.156]
MTKLISSKPWKFRAFLILAMLSFSIVLAVYWYFTKQGSAFHIINWQVSTFGGYYIITTFLLVWLSILVPCLPVAFVLAKLCDMLGL